MCIYDVRKRENKSNNAFLVVTLLIVMSIISGCGGGGDGDKNIVIEPNPNDSMCAGQFLESGNSCLELESRESVVYKPTSNEIKGIALFLHGAPGNVRKVMGIFDAKALADTFDLIALAPEGKHSVWGWLSENKLDEQTNDDVDFIKQLLVKVKGDYNISTDKVFVFGYSAGGFMGYKLACLIPEQLTAVISLAGQYRGEIEACSTSTPVSIHHFHSLIDEEVPYTGKTIGKILSVEDTISHWQQKNGCDVSIETVVEQGVTVNSSKTTTGFYQNCIESLALSKMESVDHEDSFIAEKLLNVYRYLLDVL